MRRVYFNSVAQISRKLEATVSPWCDDYDVHVHWENHKVTVKRNRKPRNRDINTLIRATLSVSLSLSLSIQI